MKNVKLALLAGAYAISSTKRLQLASYVNENENSEITFGKAVYILHVLSTCIEDDKINLIDFENKLDKILGELENETI